MEITKATKKKTEKIVKGVLFYGTCVVLTIFFMFPIYVMISRSFMTAKEVMSITAKLWSASPSFDAYKTALDGAFFFVSVFTDCNSSMVLLALLDTFRLRLARVKNAVKLLSIIYTFPILVNKKGVEFCFFCGVFARALAENNRKKRTKHEKIKTNKYCQQGVLCVIL